MAARRHLGNGLEQLRMAEQEFNEFTGLHHLFAAATDVCSSRTDLLRVHDRTRVDEAHSTDEVAPCLVAFASTQRESLGWIRLGRLAQSSYR